MSKEEKFGKITELKGYRALVKLKDKEGAGEETVDALNNINAKCGDRVRIVWRETGKKMDIGMIIAPPLLCLVAGAIFGYRLALYLKQPVGIMMAGSITLWLLLGGAYSFRYWRYAYGRGRQPVVDRVVA